jgi:predicted DsbA family dithiol-disulfide isomerase
MLEELRRRTARSGLDIILIDVWEGAGAREEARRYRDLWRIGATILLDEDAAYTRRLGIRGVPTNVVVDRQGIVRAVGASTHEQLRDALAPIAPTAARLLDEELRLRSNDEWWRGRGPIEG